MYSSRHTRTLSPPLSTASALTTTPQPRLNVVTRLAIQGKVKQGQDGASIKLYLKLSIPLDSVSPGSTLPLFPEENLKLLSAQVHPIDNNSVPYAFSSSTCPMLNSAARALNLPPRSSKSYLSLFGISPPAASLYSSRPSSSSTSAPTTPLDDKYTGHIIVSGYNIAYILPKDFPPRFVGDESALRVSTFSAAKMRRGSITERSNLHFMAAVDLFVPFASRPPRAPFLISIPIPRCLSNNVKLRISPPAPTSTSASVASLSSAEEDPGAWELASEPHVTRTTSRVSRSSSYGNMADDESSDSSTYDGSSGGIVVQGTFPSTDRLRIRWAQPTKTIPGSGDGRGRVGVREVRGEMSTFVSGKARDPSGGRYGVLMKVEYKATCKGVWFPGVATMLGMDVSLDARNSDVYWGLGEETQWTISGGAGYTGFDVGPATHIARLPSLEFPSPASSSGLLQTPPMTSRQDSSTSSLLRAPLPADQLPDYSFEGSPTSLAPSGTLSSLSSTPLTSGGRSRAPSDPSPPLPAVPLTIHVNINDIPANNVFTFTISGTILVIPKSRSGVMNGRTSHSGSSSEDEKTDPIPIVLPRFTVLAADSESISMTIRNDTEGATVEVYNISGDLRDAQTRRTVLQRNGMTRCGSDGGRIALRSISQLAVPKRSRPQLALENMRLSPRSRTPTGHRESAIGPPSVVHTQGLLTRRRRNGPLIIPSVDILVTPLSLRGSKFPNAHAVRMHMYASPDADSEWLEFGLARTTGSTEPSSLSSTDSKEHFQVDIDIVNVNVDGIPVRFESRTFGKQNQIGATDLGPSFDEKSHNDWIAWIKIQAGEQGGRLSVDYIVKQHDDHKSTKDVKGKSKAMDKSHVDILLPSFALAIGRMDVTIDAASDIESVCTNFAHQQQRRMLHYSLEEFFCPKLALILRSDSPRVHMGYMRNAFILSLGLLPVVLLLILLTNVGSEFRQMRHAFDLFVTRRNLDWEQFPAPVTETVFVTTTVYTSSRSVYLSPTLTSILSTSTSLAPPNHSSSRSSSVSSSRPLEQITPTTTTELPQFATESSYPPPREDSLLPISALPFDWTLPPDFIPTAQRSWHKLVGGLGVVWQVMRKVYHYPLDPP
ncbi:hypothetical protein V8B97DRAFT_1940399 [Scleroderma yunnanense]